jgi:hypothetical protein
MPPARVRNVTSWNSTHTAAPIANGSLSTTLHPSLIPFDAGRAADALIAWAFLSMSDAMQKFGRGFQSWIHGQRSKVDKNCQLSTRSTAGLRSFDH